MSPTCFCPVCRRILPEDAWHRCPHCRAALDLTPPEDKVLRPCGKCRSADTAAVAPEGEGRFGPAAVVRFTCRRCGHTDEWVDTPGEVDVVRQWAALLALPDYKPPK